jgi:hypothetical protein
LSQVQEFALKADLAIALPGEESRKAVKRLGEEIRVAIYQRNPKVDLMQLFPELRPKSDPEELLQTTGPSEITTNVSAAEAMADIEAILQAEATGTLTPDELFEDEDDRPTE